MRPPDRGFTLPRDERLRQARDFQGVFQRGLRTERPSFVMLWWVTDGRRGVGFAVSRHVRGAVHRNRIRRRLREAYRRRRTRVPSGMAAVFVGRPPAETTPFVALVEEMEQAIEMAVRRAQRERPALSDGARNA